MFKTRKGFTLIELLVVIGIIAILAGIVLVAVNPSRNFASSRNATREHDVSQILSAVVQYATDNDGTYPSGISATPVNVSTIATDLAPTYMPSVPTDPKGEVDYTVSQDTEGRITVSAPGAENNETISVTQ
ncbi:MAG: hypothetical protein UR93_C0012G0004 [Berkelbacteria bacterium GW2011_GWA2_35_9]|uniref:Uncharacterized protein n=1 Tax=Berkelbacteria bacterium GW2011_GWA2_35_9 TaxID=1618333 RepID=A0A0G0DI99_9BACT|nr:MAG: hypothetical protein UR93_C0012G0004 [Berkelbacteria bacterium GW2011_GWA2_35_9]